MTTAKYGISTALNQADWERLRKLQKAGIKVVDILKAGIAVKEKEIQKQ